MNLLKALPLRLGILLVLVGAVLLPPAVSAMQDTAQMNKIVLEKVESTAVAPQTPLSMPDKIGLMTSLGIQGKSVMMTEQKKAENTSVSADQIQPICIEELSKLQKINVFPPVDLTKTVDALSYSVQTYVDINKPSTYAIIWKVDMEYDGFTVDLYMDDQTHLILGYSLLQKNSAVSMLDYKAMIANYAGYLGLDKSLFTQISKGNTYIQGEYKSETDPFSCMFHSYFSDNFYSTSINFYMDYLPAESAH